MLTGLRLAAQRVGQGRTLRAVLRSCTRLLSERGGANSGAIAAELVQRFGELDEAGQLEFFEHLARDFSPAPAVVLKAATAYAAQPAAATLIALTKAAEPPRQELLRRINQAAGGTAAIIAMRRTLLGRLRERPELAALESDLLHLLSSWFNPGFLQMQQVDWNSPARLLEQLIEHEAVHAIDGWDDLRRRLGSDRRCFAFFHPQLPGEPLIFVEVALVAEMPAAIGPLIDKRAEPMPAEHYKVATFYSISNCQPGLRGVSLGNFLIKRVAEQLKRELPQLKTFCTLSPVPGFARWLRDTADVGAIDPTLRSRAARLAESRQLVLDVAGARPSSAALAAAGEPLCEALRRLCAAYVLHGTAAGQGDPVARFHLDNGARLERVNALADGSANGLRQSFGTMVNYLYALDHIEANHELFVRGGVAHARAVAGTI